VALGDAPRIPPVHGIQTGGIHLQPRQGGVGATEWRMRIGLDDVRRAVLANGLGDATPLIGKAETRRDVCRAWRARG
jgi:hypothetical protein